MPVISVRIPQLGEGLQEARLVELLKKPGDTIKRDDPIYVMETDKAVSEVESPYDGTLVEWVAEPNSVLPIGTEIAKMEVAEGVEEIAAGHGPTHAADSPSSLPQAVAAAPVPISTTPQVAAANPATTSSRTRIPIPPRTRKYLREKGLLDKADQIPAAGKKLMPADVDRYIEDPAEALRIAAGGGEGFDVAELSASQQTLNYRMQRGVQNCVAATISVEVDWTALFEARQQTRETGGETSFAMLLACVTEAMKTHAGFRSSLSPDGKIVKTYHHVNLGVAVAIPGDLLRTAVVRDADKLPRHEFFEQLQQQIELVRDGADQIDGSTTVTVSNIGSAKVSWGIPVVVPPAGATLAVGAIYDRPIPTTDGFAFVKTATLTMTFDHRVINGVGAANFLNEVKQLAEAYALETSQV
jgi:pyruvate dehydrogenase E2 component (dihydrolipoamide acetyltransferase)